ncbi:hypothetical protein RI367_006774 [Sorochytrium milnesiophthora]
MSSQDADEDSLQQLPWWCRLPNELRHALLTYTDVITAIHFRDLRAVRQCLRNDHMSADIKTQRAWWTAVLRADWVDAANVLLAGYVPFLPVVRDDNNEDYEDEDEDDDDSDIDGDSNTLRPGEAMLQLLTDSPICTGDLKNRITKDVHNPDVPKPRWCLVNIDTLFTLARRLPSESSARVQIMQTLLNCLPKRCIKRLLRILARHGDIDTIAKLHFKLEQDLQPTFLPPGDAGREHGVKLLSWLRDRKRPARIKVRYTDLAEQAIIQDNWHAYKWCCEQPAYKASPLRMPHKLARAHCSVSVMEGLWLASEGQLSQDEHHHLGCSVMSGDAISLALLQWLDQRYPAAFDNFSTARPSIVKNMDVLRWLQAHRPDIKCPPLTLLLALQFGQTDAATFLATHYPSTLRGLRKLDCAPPILAACWTGSTATLDWLATHYPGAFASRDAEAFSDYEPPAATWDWFLQHPSFAPWRSKEELVELYAKRFSLTRANSDNGQCTRAMYNLLQPTRGGMPGMMQFFAESAIAVGDAEWLREVAADFEVPLDELCTLDMLYEPQHFPLLRRMYQEFGVTPPPDAVAAALESGNHDAIQWLLDTYTGFDWASTYEFGQAGHLPLLRYIASKCGLCKQCIEDLADMNHQLHVLAWCRDQTLDCWAPCERHEGLEWLAP